MDILEKDVEYGGAKQEEQRKTSEKVHEFKEDILNMLSLFTAVQTHIIFFKCFTYIAVVLSSWLI